jgi:hypothetical protein
MDMNLIQTTILEIVQKTPADQLQQGSVLREAAKALNVERDIAKEQAILTCWDNLLRNGHLSWGYNLSNPNPPFVHVTEKGIKVLQAFSHDPANPAGYMAHLASTSLHPLAFSYVDEALKTFNNNCFKASAVMIGCAAESLVLDLRDAIVTKLKSLGRTPSADLTHWKISRVLRAIQNLFEQQSLPSRLEESFDAHWSGFTGQLRIIRNDAGHPQSLAPILEETVHGNLLLFPSMAKLARELKEWVNTSFT